jgi:hypothetical protein
MMNRHEGIIDSCKLAFVRAVRACCARLAATAVLGLEAVHPCIIPFHKASDLVKFPTVLRVL